MAAQGVGHKVHASDLPGDTSEQEVSAVFVTYGKVLSIQMLQPGPDGLRSAIVVYDSAEAAEDAEDALDGVYSIRHNVQRPIRVQRPGSQAAPQAPSAAAAAAAPAAAAPAAAVAGGDRAEQLRAAETPWEGPRAGGARGASRLDGIDGTKIFTEGGMIESHKLFVGSLPPDITEEEVKLVFNTYGTVLRVILLGSHPLKGRSAFVMYREREAGEDAIEVLHEVYKIRPSYPFTMQVRWANKVNYRKEGGGWEAATWDGAAGWDWHGDDWSAAWMEDYSGWSGSRGKGSKGWQESSWSGASGKSGGKGKKGAAAAVVAAVERKAAGGPGERVCPSPGCNFLVTWHSTHCCQVCGYWPGDHGPKCEQRLRGSLQGQPGDGGKGGSSASTAQPGAADGAGGAGPAGAAAAQGRAAGGGASQAPPSRVHVFANLPGDVDEKSLKYVFETYGMVTRVRLERDEANEGRAHAFIDFGTAWDAETSVMSLDNQYEIRKGFGPLRVKLATARSESAPY